MLPGGDFRNHYISPVLPAHRRPRSQIIGCDLHSRRQTLGDAGHRNGEVVEKVLAHDGRFASYRSPNRVFGALRSREIRTVR